MKRGEQIRNLTLAATLFSGLLVLGKVALTPNRQPEALTYAFPEKIPLENWQFDRSDPIDVQRLQGPSLITSVDDLAIAGRNYRYSRNGQQLNIEMRYFSENYVDVVSILRDANLQRMKPEISAQASVHGSYALFTESGTQYLSACITPTNRTTVSEADFRRELNRPEVIANRLMPWLLGFAPLRDLRCVWTKLSIRPVNSNVGTAPQSELEQVWQQWAQWWKQNYPPES